MLTTTPVLHIYPGICTLTAAMLGMIAMYDLVSSWSQTVRDKEYLMELRLLNLELSQESKDKLELVGDTTAMEEDEED